MAYNELDKMKFSYTIPSVGKYQRIDPTEIYLAKPGKRVIGKLNGIDEDSAHLEINLQNTSVLEFTVNRVIDGEIANFYDLIDQHYELFAKGFGWFKINEEPEMSNDGTLETKNVRAESLEIELQQFDLVGFEINTGSQWSREMLALDNTYEVVEDYTAPRDSVKFWRDLSKWDAFIEAFPTDGTAHDITEALKDNNNTFLFDSWRIIFDLDGFDAALKAAEAVYREQGNEVVADFLKDQIGQVKEQTEAFQITRLYPEVRKNLTAVDFDTTYTDEYGEEQEGTVREMLIRERERLHELSFLDLVLKETGWKVGYVDTYYNESSDIPEERLILADQVGYFQVDSQDVYSFITQEAAQYFRCVFDFNTEDYTVNAYKIENLGKKTNIFLNFHNIQNSVSRTSDRKYYTVYHVANGTGDDNIDIKEANFGTDAIEDISYFLNTKHFPQELIDRYLEWKEFIETQRQPYMDLAVEYRDQNDVVMEIKSRVPKDGADQKQYSSFTVEELEAERENYIAEKRGYEIMHVDDQNEFDFEDLKASRDWPNYKMIIGTILSRPKEYTLDRETVLNLPTKALMVMEPDDTIYNKIIAANEAKEQLDSLPAEIEDLQDRIANAQTEIARIEAEIGDQEPTASQASELAAARERLATLQADLAEAQQTLSGLPDELADYEAAISAYYEDHESSTLLDDDTIETVMIYSLYENHLGHIDTELYNRWMVKYRNVGEVIEKLEFDEDYLYDFATYGDSYGLDELKAQLKRLEDAVELEKQYAGKADQSDEYHKKHYALYLKYLDAYNACKAELDERQEEYDTENAELTRISNAMLDINNSVKKENFVDSKGNKFTEKELWLLQRYYINTDYTNDNIVVTNVFTNEQIVKTEYDLYKDALEQLYADSHPQWQYSTTQDNFLMMPELQDWHGDLEIGNFIRVGFREDDPYYIHTYDAPNQVKLRLTTIGLNPFMIEPTIDLTFSTMIQYKSKRNDFVEIIGSASGGSGKNKITANYNGTKEGNINISSDFIAKLLNSGAFTNGIANAVIGSGGFGGAVGGAITDAINNMDISVAQIGDLTTKLSDLVNGYVDANVITTKILYADQAHINQIKSELVDTETVIARLVDATDVQAQTVSAKLVTTDSIVTGLINAQEGDFDELTANSAFIEYLNSGVIDAGTVTADNIIAGLASVTPEQKEKFNILAGSAFVDYLETNLVVASEIKVDELKAKLADISVADIDELSTNHAFINSLQTLSTTAATSVVTEQYVMNLVAGNISVADLATHTATAQEIVLISADGTAPAIAFKGATQQFYDSDGNVRVQIGQDGNGDFNFIVTGADGTTALFDYNGITKDGIPQNTIVNNMIEAGTINKDRLSFPIIETNQDGTINITDIKDGSGNNFGVSYTTFTQNTSDAIDDLTDGVDEINRKKMYRVVIESDNGNIFKNGDVNCTLSCKVYSWDDDITDDINSANFKWKRKSKDTTGDAQWNANHSGGAKTLTVTPSDVFGRSVFYCDVTLPDGSIASGS